MYRGEVLFQEMLDYLYSKGFELFSISPNGFNIETGRLAQVDAIFVKP